MRKVSFGSGWNGWRRLVTLWLNRSRTERRQTGLSQVFTSLGFQVERQGKYSNVLALPEKSFKEMILVGAHYDSVPKCPGADDNGSAVAAMLGCAAACSLWRPVLARSDHAPFWAGKMRAVMWTDTSEFRNHNYHRQTDTPDTLDYGFLRRVTQLLTACVIEQALNA